MAEVVHAEGRLEAVSGERALPQDEPGVVHEHVDRVGPVEQRSGEGPDRCDAGQVETQHLDLWTAAASADLLDGAGTPLLVAGRDDHPGAEPRQPDGGLLADAGVAAGDDDRPSLHRTPSWIDRRP